LRKHRRVAALSAVGERPALTATAQAVLPGTPPIQTPGTRAVASASGAVDRAGAATTTHGPLVALVRVATAAGATAGVAEIYNLASGSDGYERGHRTLVRLGNLRK